MATTAESAVESSNPDSIGGRYQVIDLLGRGGMACVYRVTDANSGRTLALKQLALPPGAKHPEETATLFEREFRVLAELSHPRIIEVFDYGLGAEGPYYTMELLDGRDVRERSPLPWREACALLYDVCSSLALIHSRRLVHRDISPRNIRCTHDGQAKLIDFGTMVPMGPSGLIVGTPAFVAPEVVHLSALDARTDLFSLGATLYYALTGRSPYSARSFSQLVEAWKSMPPPPSRLVEGIPQAVDDLVMSLISLEPAMRPRVAFDVMQRLAAVAGIERIEPASVLKAYLSTPVMVGRQEPMGALTREMARAFDGHGRGIVIEGAAGLGRSRMLDASVLEAKTLGATVLRAAAGAAGKRDFAAVQALAEQVVEAFPDDALAAAEAAGIASVLFDAPLLESDTTKEDGARPHPKLKDFTLPSQTKRETLAALCTWFLGLCTDHALTIAVDDAHRIDDTSAGFLTTLLIRAGKSRLLVVITVESGVSESDPAALAMFAKRSTKVTLAPLSEAETEELVCSLFGDVPNLGVICQGIHRVAAGNPRVCMDLAQHLVDKGVLHYDRGIWSLPDRLDAADLPSSAEEAIRQRIAALSPSSRRLVEAQALASHDTFTRDDYGVLWSSQAEHGAHETHDQAISELLLQQVLASDGQHYRLSHRGWASALLADLHDEERQERHRALVSLYERKLEPATIRHLLEGGMHARGLDRLRELLGSARESADLYTGHCKPAEVAAMLEHAERAARTLKRGAREMNDIGRWLVSVSVSADDAVYWRAAPAWLAQLQKDSGLLLWQSLADVEDPKERLSRALALAKEQYLSTQEEERVYRSDEAIRLLLHYVVMSIAIGSRSLDARLIDSLPALIEPFAPLSHVISAILENARATREARCLCQPERARNRWIDVIERLKSVTSAELPFVDGLRAACFSGVAAMEASLGLSSATTWTELLEQTPAQAVNALYLRKAVRLQQGDWEGAERMRRQAELQSLGARSRQMFTNSLPVELAAHAMANDLTGLRQIIDRIEPLAETSPGWRIYRQLAEGHFQRICGNLPAAREAFERCIADSSPAPDDRSRVVSAWLSATAGYIETLSGLGKNDEARACGELALTQCQELGIEFTSHEISRALALVEGKLGDFTRAVERLETVIRDQTALGVTGLLLGASYEARARVAIAMQDDAAVETYGRLTAQAYRHGRGSPLGARYERLMDEARRTVAKALPKLSEFEATRLGSTEFDARTTLLTIVSQAMSVAAGPAERANCALGLLCENQHAASGFLYLFDETGLKLVASRGEGPPADEVLAFATSYLDGELETYEDATKTLGERASPSFATDGVATCQPLLLRSAVGGDSQYAGVAVLLGSRGREPKTAAMLLEALGTHLLQAGDTRGLPIPAHN